MPRKVKDFEEAMIYAFKSGLNAGYGINHENIQEEEKQALINFCEHNLFRFYGRINEPQI